MKNITTIVSDLDGTLLNEHSELSERTVRVMKKCIERGIRVILASGRTQNSIRHFVEILGTRQPYISGNGSEISSADHQLIYQEMISRDNAREIIRFIEEQGLYVQAYQEERFYYSHLTDDIMSYQKSSRLQGICVENLSEWLPFPTNKLLSIASPERVRELLPVVAEKFRGIVEVTAGSPRFLEIISVGVSKGNALRILTEKLGITPEECVVFGDCLNDQSMLAFSPNSVAVANAQKEVLQTANYVCGPNTQDGVAEFIEKEVLFD